MPKLLLLFTAIFTCCLSYSQHTISGKLTDSENGEDMPFATIYVKGSNTGTTSNAYGFYSVTVPEEFIKEGKTTLVFGFIGYTAITKEIEVSSDVKLNVKLKPSMNTLDEVLVETAKTRQQEELKSTEMSTTRMQMKEIKTLPSLGGETDIVKVVQLLPGVQGGTEGGTGMFVRGGDADQNLVLLDEATVYNIGHLFGFFSVFNSDAIKDMTMIKGAFPAQYGGRLSSILDIHMKDGHDQKIHGQGGIGLLSSRFTLEGPVKKEKSTFLISGRRTYIDKVFKAAGLFVPYYFYDLNGKFSYKIGENDRLFYSVYYGNDVLSFDENDVNDADSTGQDTATADLGLDFGFKLGNLTNTVRWNHIYNSKLFSNVSLISTAFKYDITGKVGSNNLFISSNVFDIGAKADFDYYKSATQDVKFGGAVISHTFKPNVVSTAGEISDFLASSQGEKMYTQEWALYANHSIEINPLLKVSYGGRLTGAFVKGKAYAGIEPRVAGRYLLNENDAIKLSYSRMKQYMHRVSSSTVALPTDLWYPITAQIKPQTADQVALGYNHLFEEKSVAVTLEAYYKHMNNLIEYREGANLILNNNFENELLQGKGDAYGTELLIRKDKGKFTGWISYTLSWATRQYDELNQGKRFFAKYDRRHTASIVGNYKISDKWTISAVWVYQTGSRFTAQIGQYMMPNATLTGVDVIPIFTERNAVQMSPSHRLDLNFTRYGKKDKKFQSEWSFGCYNLYNYAQPYRVNIVPTDNGLGYKYQQPGLFGFIPSIAYNFKF